MICLLLAMGAKPDVEDAFEPQDSPLRIAMSRPGCAEIAKLLSDHVKKSKYINEFRLLGY